MNIETCLKKLSDVGTLAFATVDEQGAPQIRNVSAIHYEKNAIYFFTAKGKNFCQELLRDGRVQVLGLTKYKEMIRLSGKVVVTPEEEQKKWMDTVFAEQPYLENVYPGETKTAGIIFQITDGEIEYFNLGERPIFRESYSFGNHGITQKGYHITDKCISCGTCSLVCPQKAIIQGTPYKIEQEHCLHCGNCEAHCPVNAVERY